MAWHGMAWHGMAWHGIHLARLPLVGFVAVSEPAVITQPPCEHNARRADHPNVVASARYLLPRAANEHSRLAAADGNIARPCKQTAVFVQSRP